MANIWREWNEDSLVEESGRYTAGKGAHAELQRRLMVNIQDLDKSSTSYSSRLFALTVVLAFLALSQLIVSIFLITTNENWQLGLTALVLWATLFILWYLRPKE